MKEDASPSDCTGRNQIHASLVYGSEPRDMSRLVPEEDLFHPGLEDGGGFVWKLQARL